MQWSQFWGRRFR